MAKTKFFFTLIFSTFFFLLTSLSFPSVVFAKILFYDDFENGIPEKWDVINGKWIVENGTYIGEAFYDGTNHYPSFSTAGNEEWEDFIFETAINGIGGVDKSIEFRFKGTNNNYVINLRSRYDNTGNDISLVKNFPGGFRLLDIKPIDLFTVTNNQWYRIKILINGNNIKAFVNNNLFIDYSDAENAPSEGKISLQIWPGSYLGPGVYATTKTAYDNILVAELDTPVHPSDSTINADTEILPADNKTETLIIVRLIDFNGNPVSGKKIECFSSRNGTDIVSQPTAPTNANGQTTCAIKSSTPGESIISVKDTTDNIDLLVSTKIIFIPPQEESFPLLFLPGHGASWSWKGILFDQDIPQEEWKILPVIHDYDNLFKTLTENAGYTLNKDFFIFHYNWRHKTEESSKKLKEFINNTVLKDKPSGTKVKIIAHSYGGLVARDYLQGEESPPVEKLITLGSPHQGVLDTYYAWEGGEIITENPWQKLAFELLVKLYQKNFATKRETIQEMAPGTKDLFPIFSFLKDQEGNIKLRENMKIRNDWLLSLRDNLEGEDNYKKIFLKTISGTGFPTLEWIKTKDSDWLDKALGNWPDGKPEDNFTSLEGDGTVLEKSASINGGENFLLNLSHGDLVKTELGQQKILDLLGIQTSIVSLPTPEYTQGLVFFLHSPATLEVTGPTGSLIQSFEEGKIVVVFNPPDGQYEVKVKGEEEGFYQLDIGQIDKENITWQEQNGQIKEGEIINYQFDYQQEKADQPLEIPFQANLTSAKTRILSLINYISQSDLPLWRKRYFQLFLRRALSELERNQIEKGFNRLLQFSQNLTLDYKKDHISRDFYLPATNEILTILTFLKGEEKGFDPLRLLKEIEITGKFLEALEGRLGKLNLTSENKGSEIGMLFSQAKNSFLEARNYQKEGKYFLSHLTTFEAKILGLSAQLLK